MKLLTTENSKLMKSKETKYMLAGVHLYPAVNYRKICPGSTPECRKYCLVNSGHGMRKSVIKSRIDKTNLFLNNPDKFMYILKLEMKKFINKAKRNNKQPVFRLNLTSDIDYTNLITEFSDVQFYDYTRVYNRIYIDKFKLPNYYMLYSHNNDALSKTILEAGHNVSMIFNNELPMTWNGFDVIDGDKDDLRFLENPGCVVGLKLKSFKGKNSYKIENFKSIN